MQYTIASSDQKHVLAESIPVFVMSDRKTRLLSAHVVRMKGAIGLHSKLFLIFARTPWKTGDPLCSGSSALVSDVARMRGDAVTISDHSAVGDSQGNGFIERAVRTVEEMVRTLKLDLEARISETPEAYSQSDSAVDRTCSGFGEQGSGRSGQEDKFRMCEGEAVQRRHSSM